MIRFVIGRAGSGKSAHCLREIHEELRVRPMGDSIIYLVPEQMTFQSQQALSAIGGSIRAQVFSFSRLAWRVLQETGGMNRFHIDEAGVHMLLRKVVEGRKNELRVFGRASEQNGFFEQLGGMITEFKRQHVSPAGVYGLWQELDAGGQVLLANKMHDLQLLYEDFEQALFGKYVDAEDYLRFLVEKLPLSPYAQGATVYVDGFHTFTAQELAVLQQLLVCGANMQVTLTLDDVTKKELDLFYTTSKTYDRLLKMAQEVGVKVEKPVVLEKQLRFTQPSLGHLEKFFTVRPYQYFGGEAALALSAATNRRAEVEGVAREIRRLVREKGYRYRDIAVMVRNGSDYYDTMRTVFASYHLPYFIDQKRTMLHHPLVELVRSVLEVIEGNWRHDAVFRCIKTELLFPIKADKHVLRKEMDLLENYCLAYGVQGKKWTGEERWVYRRYRSLEHVPAQTDQERAQEEKVNELRALVVKPILKLQKRLKAAKSGLQMCEAVYLFLEELQIPKKLEQLRQEAEEEGDLLFAKDHEQVWQEVISLLDTYVEILGEGKQALSLFMEVLDTGLDALRFANIPPSLDHVLVANLDRSRLSTKVLFLVGVNEGVMPMVPPEEGVLSEQERELLLGRGVELAPTARQKLLDEQFILYEAVTRASEYLYLSYPLADEEGKTLLPSSVLKKVKGMFPQVVEQFVTNEVQETSASKQMAFVTTPEVTLSYVTQRLQGWKRAGYRGNMSFWWDVYNFYVTTPLWQRRSERVLSSLFYRNVAPPLSREVSEALYGNMITGSVSRMELFQRCSYAHFAQHGLRLRERDVFRIEAPEIGELFHAALKNIADRLAQLHKSWSDLTVAECEILSFEAMEALAPLLQKEILLSSHRHHYLKHKLQQVIYRASLILREHARASRFVPVDLEVPFGMGKGALPPLQFQLPNGTKMEVVGRIDRVDKAESEEGTFLRIVDYKSSEKTLDLQEVYYGLSLQMLTYLDVVVENARKWVEGEAIPAGVLYFHIHNPMIELKQNIVDVDIERELLRKFKMKGLLLGEPAVMQVMDHTVTNGSSDIVAAGLKRDGSFSANSSIASTQEFGLLKSYVHRTFQDIGTNITEGMIEIAPYKLKTKEACTFCQFQSVCQFDDSLDENKYRTLQPLNRKEALEKMREDIVYDEKTSR